MSMMQNLSRAQCAAVFVMLLDDDEAATLLGKLDPEELQLVGSTMCSLGEVDPRSIADAIAGFVVEAEYQSLPAGGREDQVKSILTRAIGETKTESMMQRILPDAKPRSLQLARWLSPKILASLVEQEHPQVIAVLLLMLDAQPAAQVLALLAPEVQPKVVERIARLGPVSGDAIEMLDSLLSERISHRFGPAALSVGGARDAANLINLAEEAVGRTVMPAIRQEDAELAQAIEAEMFTFEMLYELDNMGMGRLLRDIENEVLIDALKGLDDDRREPFFAAMSSRAADGVRDEIELRGKLRRSEALEAQRKIVEIARKLADDGEIALGQADGEFV